MWRPRKRKCRGCKKFYDPDRRTWRWQKYCGEEVCRKASKAESQRRWLSKPENVDYFCGPEHAARVRRWRAENPERAARRGTKTKNALQDERVAQLPGNINESANLGGSALQDVMASQQLVLIGLIANLTESTLQDEIAITSRRLLRLGQDVVKGARWDGGKTGAESGP